MYNVSLSDSSSSPEKPAAGGKRKSAIGCEEQPKAKKTKEQPAACGGKKQPKAVKAKEQPAAGSKEQPKAKTTNDSGATDGKEQPKRTKDKARATKSAEKPATGGIVDMRRSVESATQRPPKTKQEAATHLKATETAMAKPLTQKPATGGNTSSYSYYSDDDCDQDESASSAEPPVASPATQKQEDQA